MTRMRPILAVAFASLMAVTAIAPSATAAPKQGGITQQSCESQGGTYSSTKGTRTCTTTTTTTTSDPTPYYGSTQLDQNNTYYTGTFHKETTTTTTTTSTQRGNQTPTTTTQTSSQERYVADSCIRVDNYHQPNETVTPVANSECDSRIEDFRYL